MYLVKLNDYDPEVYAELAMKLLEGYVVGFAYKHYLPGLTSEDLAQELRLVVWKNLEHYDPDKSQLGTWAYWQMKGWLSNQTRKKKEPLDYTIFDENL